MNLKFECLKPFIVLYAHFIPFSRKSFLPYFPFLLCSVPRIQTIFIALYIHMYICIHNAADSTEVAHCAEDSEFSAPNRDSALQTDSIYSVLKFLVLPFCRLQNEDFGEG